jgi:hypothetical protein
LIRPSVISDGAQLRDRVATRRRTLRVQTAGHGVTVPRGFGLVGVLVRSNAANPGFG